MRGAALLLALAAVASLTARAEKRSGATPPCAPGSPGEMVEVPEGTHLYSKPGRAGDSLVMVDVDLTLPVRSRCGNWVEVVYDGLRGYVLPGDAYIPPLDIGFTAAVGVTADSLEERLNDARSAMKGKAREAPLGPWTAVTDVPQEDLARLARVATHLAAGYAERYGLKPAPPGEQAVALFTNLRDYRAFLAAAGVPGATLTRVAGVDMSPRSHVEGDLVGTSLRDGPKLARIHLVHELTHLLQRRTFPGPLPRWLSEGVAEDLAWCRVDEAGRLDLGSIQGLFFMKAGARIDVDSQGPSAALEQYVRTLRRAPLGPAGLEKGVPLAALLSGRVPLGSAQGGFVRGISRTAVTEAGLFVRFLLDGERDLTPTGKRFGEVKPGRRALRFRAFLSSVAAGGPSDAAALFAALKADPAAVEHDFDDWVLWQIAANR